MLTKRGQAWSLSQERLEKAKGKVPEGFQNHLRIPHTKNYKGLPNLKNSRKNLRMLQSRAEDNIRVEGLGRGEGG